MTIYDKLQNELTKLTVEANRQYTKMMSELVNNTKNYSEYELKLKEKEVNIQFGKLTAYSTLNEALKEFRGKKNDICQNK